MTEQLILSPESAVNVFGAAIETPPTVIGGEQFTTQHNVEVKFTATTLGLTEMPNGVGALQVTRCRAYVKLHLASPRNAALAN